MKAPGGNAPAPRAQVGATPAGSLADEDLRRRVIYLMLFRLVLISLVLGTTILIAWLSDADLRSPSFLVLFAIIATTYLLTIVYARAVVRVGDLKRLADVQLALDLITSTLLVHVTGGAQSAYTFFFPLSIIAAATIRFRAGAVTIALVATLLFTSVSLLGWLGLLPVPTGQRLLPSDMSAMGLGRALALNLAAFAGVAMLAYNLGGQIQRTSASLETQRTATADLYALHEDIVRCLSSGLITVDARNVVLTINQAACEILATSPAPVVGQLVEQVLPGIQGTLARIPERGAVRRAELIIPHPDRARQSAGGEQCLGLSVSPLRNNGEEVIGRVIHFQDLTELRQMEQQMRQAERLAVVGTLAAGVAHEIRNPLAAISGSIELLNAAPQADEEGRALMSIVTREVDRLNQLITDLLDYTNPQPREMVGLDMADLVRETIQVFEQDPSIRGITVTLDGAGTPERRPLEVVADPGRIRQLLWNLLRNAAEAARTRVTVQMRQDDDMVVTKIADDGAGIAAENLERIFDPFFTTKNQGSGLGLATCHSIVQEHGGSIHAENRAGGGCVFVTRLPASTERGDQERVQEPSRAR